MNITAYQVAGPNMPKRIAGGNPANEEYLLDKMHAAYVEVPNEPHRERLRRVLRHVAPYLTGKRLLGAPGGRRADVTHSKAIRRAIELARKVYDFSGVGGPLHVVLDDENVETHHIKWCIENANTYSDSPEETDAARVCGEHLLTMSMTQRRKLVGRHYGDYCDGTPIVERSP